MDILRRLWKDVVRKRPVRRSARRLSMERLEGRHLLAAAPLELSFDFGTARSPQAADFMPVTESTRYTPTGGFGWVSGAVYSRDRGTSDALRRDFNFTRDGTFAVDVPNGDYDVQMILGDVGQYAHDLVGIFLEGDRRDTVTTAAGQVTQRTHDVAITDGQLTLRIADLGGRDANGVIESLRIIATGPSRPELTIGDLEQAEGDSGTSLWEFPVTLSSATDQQVSVQFSTRDGSATAAVDYTSSSGALTIPAGQTAGTIRVPVHGDQAIEGNEEFYLDLQHVTAATLSRERAIGRIINDDQAASLHLSVTPSVVSEGIGSQAVQGKVTRSGATTDPLIVALSSNDPATALTPATVNIPAGQQTATFPVTIVDDSIVDGTQQVTLSASAGGSGYTAGQSTLEVTDDDQPPFAGRFDFGTSGSPVMAGFQQIHSGSRYTSGSGFGWTAGAIRAADRRVGTSLTRDFTFSRDSTFVIDAPNGRYQVNMILGDLGRYAHDAVGVYLEGDHVDSVTTAAGVVTNRSYEADLSDGQLTVRIRDLGGRDANGVIESLEIAFLGHHVPTLTVGDAQIDEGNAGTQDLLFPISLSTVADGEVRVDYTTGDISATHPSDYLAASGTLRIPPGSTTGTVRVTVAGDDRVEPDETLHLMLSNLVGATLGNGPAIGTIRNDDFLPILTVSVAPGSIVESAGPSAATGQVSRTGPTTSPLIVQLSSSDLSEATVPATVEIPAGSTTAPFPIDAQDDSETDQAQSVILTASAAGHTAGHAPLEVADDDQPPFEAYFDFGTTTSPLSAGFTRVSEATRYSVSQGYGWLTGLVGSRDRRAGGTVERDINFMRDGTFVVDVPNGSYRLDMILGDKAAYAHDAMDVYLEGAHAATVSTAARQVVNRSLEVDVTDGQLTLRLLDRGGGDANVVIEGLRILAAHVDDPASDAWWPAQHGIPDALFSEPIQVGPYDYISVESSYQRSTNNLRVLLPSDYDPQQTYPVIYVLPVEKGNATQFGDGLTTIRSQGLHLQHDAIFVAPTFSDIPWYADHVTNQSVWQETYFRSVVVPFIEQQYPVTDGPEGRLLLGFSKSGYGAVSMLLRYPDYFGRVVAWDSPLAMSDPASGYGFLGVLGSRDHFQQNYQITNLLETEGAYLEDSPARIFLQGYSYGFTRADHVTIDALMTDLEIPHTYDEGVYRGHVWASGWMPGAVEALLQVA